MYLFIGGPADGKKLAVDGRETVYMPLYSDPKDSNTLSIKQIAYRRCDLAGLDKRYFVYVAEDNDPRDVIARLIDGYVGV